jgi:hypothetical protein
MKIVAARVVTTEGEGSGAVLFALPTQEIPMDGMSEKQRIRRGWKFTRMLLRISGVSLIKGGSCAFMREQREGNDVP